MDRLIALRALAGVETLGAIVTLVLYPDVITGGWAVFAVLTLTLLCKREREVKRLNMVIRGLRSIRRHRAPKPGKPIEPPTFRPIGTSETDNTY